MNNEQNDIKWFAVTVNAEPAATDAVEFALDEMGAVGTAIDHLRRTSSDTVAIEGYFNELPDLAELNAALANAVRIYELDETALIGIETATVKQTDWLAEWKKHWRPTELGGFIIAPPWETVDGGEKQVIRIEPNMAFGTGTHETTQLCLVSLEENYRPGRTFLDVGTGTGILSIAAAKLGAEVILAYETDADSVTIARENAAANGCGHIQFVEGTIGTDTPKFDVTCANVTLDVILPMLALLIEKTRETLILSGILVDQEDEIASALNGREFRITRKGEWIAATVDLH